MAINGQTVLAVIPARGGSKRCPRKNIRDFRGSPLIYWSINAGRRSKYIDNLILSTEDPEIRELALKVGSAVQIRPNELATDEASNEDVLRYVLESHPADLIVLLQPTSPLRNEEDIDTCIEKVGSSEYNMACVSFSDGNWQKNGAVYVARKEWLEKHDFSHQGYLKYYMPASRSLDIDYEADFG